MEKRALLGLAVLGLVASAFGPSDWLTWVLEVAPVMIGAPILIATHRRFPITPLLARLLLLHAAILMLGGAYTYEKVPLGDWVSAWLGWERNHYDRLGHLAQGFIPAILAREVLLRRSPLERGRWLYVLAMSVCLAFSAFYELIEWWAALLTGEGASAFLGTQGDPWDTQWDMFLCLIGANISLLTLSGLHDRHLEELEPS